MHEQLLFSTDRITAGENLRSSCRPDRFVGLARASRDREVDTDTLQLSNDQANYKGYLSAVGVTAGIRLG